MGKSRRPYNERSDIEKLESQWTKRGGHLERRDYSAAIVRCATAAEIAANVAIRHEFSSQANLSASQIDGFLKNANGLHGKMNRLLLPLRYKWDSTNNAYQALLRFAGKINEDRNSIVHKGEFRNRKAAEEIAAITRSFIESLLADYHPNYKLPEDDD